MQISLINDLQEFDELRTEWDNVYFADPHAHIYVSWIWLCSYFEISLYPWFVLAFRPDSTSSYVAFLPLSIQERKYNWQRVLRMAGVPVADYTGFVCLPEYEEEALSAFAAYTQHHLSWDIFNLRDVLDPRLEIFLSSFSENKFDVESVNRFPCPYIPLPKSWDEYLQKSISKNMRKKIRRSTKRIESLEGFRIVDTQPDNLDEQIEVLTTLWQDRWAHLWDEHTVDIFRHLLENCFKQNILWMVSLRQGTEPMAALAAYLEPSKRTFYALIGAYDPKFAKWNPGKVLDAYSIRYAIENGYEVYDYMKGNYSYKFSFGAVERFSKYMSVKSKDLRSRMSNTVATLTKKMPQY